MPRPSDNKLRPAWTEAVPDHVIGVHVTPSFGMTARRGCTCRAEKRNLRDVKFLWNVHTKAVGS